MTSTTRRCPSGRLTLATLLLLSLMCVPRAVADGPERQRLQLQDVFELEFAADPQVFTDGRSIAYVRNSFDVMTDRLRSRIWILDADGDDHQTLSPDEQNCTSPRISPDGFRIAYFSKPASVTDHPQTEIYCHWLVGYTARLTQLPRTPADLKWSPDGNWLAFSMLVPVERESLIDVPAKPKGATWAEPPKFIDRISYRADGKGYLEDGYHHLFVLPADGGTPRQVTSGDFDHKGPFGWTADGHLIVSTNRSDNWELDPREADLYAVSIETGEMKRLTDRRGPDYSPVVSPDGSKIAWLGFDDRKIGSQLNRLYVMNRDGSGRREVETKLDRSLLSPVWAPNGKSLFVQYDDRGHTKLANVSLDGTVKPVATDVGGTTIGRPYQSGAFSVATSGDSPVIAYTKTGPHRPADIAVIQKDGTEKLVTSLNADLFVQRELGQVEEFWFESSHDKEKIQAWLVTPPDFDAGRKREYPLILEIHGGPFANYGWRFSMEIQLYAAAGHAVLYVNPRGSTGYGQKFVEHIHHAYPGHDYDDLMTAVDVVLKRGFVDPDQLYVTGGSGGGILTAWVVGKTNRFRAAVSAKPVINWYSFALTTDIYPYFWQYWFSDYPWEKPEEYLKRSPLSLVGNVTTPTMLLTGENDHRTPISESEQFYQALKLRGVDAAMVRVPDASHGIVKRPSNLMNKVAYILKWFEMHSPEDVDP